MSEPLTIDCNKLKIMGLRKSFEYLLIAFAFIFVSCQEKSDPVPAESSVEANGLSKEINNLVSEIMLNQVEDLGITIHRGANPPIINGKFLGSKIELIASNIQSPPDVLGTIFPDYQCKFDSLNSNNLSVQLSYLNGYENGSGIGAYIVGTNNNFSVFAPVKSYIGTDSAEFIHIISGTLSNNSILNLNVAILMLDDFGDSNNKFIEIGEGRLFIDIDSLSPSIL